MATNLRTLSFALLLGAVQAAQAEGLPDPTRPAIDLGGGGAGVAPQVEAAPRGLQSILIAPGHRAAIINGQAVTLGDKVGDARLVEVHESSVVLQGPHGRRVMELFPGVNMKKNGASQQENAEQGKAAGQTNLPERAVGGVK